MPGVIEPAHIFQLTYLTLPFSFMVKHSRVQAARTSVNIMYLRNSPLYIKMALAGSFAMALQGSIAPSEHESIALRDSCCQNKNLRKYEKEEIHPHQ